MSRSSTSIELSPIEYPITAVLPNAEPSLQRLTRFVSDNSEHPSVARSSQEADVGKARSFVIILSVTVITGISSLLAGLVTVGLPTIARDLKLDSSLLLWPASIFSLTCGCTLLLSGAVADVVGSGNMYLMGSFLQSMFTLACGLSRSGGQLILFRGLAGIAISLCLPSAVAIVTHSFPEGRNRNVAFASMGAGQPVGFSIGLVMGGVFADTIGWRWGFYLAAVLNTLIFVMALWGLPKGSREQGPVSWSRISNDIDWVGAVIASASLALLSYVLAVLTGSTSDIRSPRTIILLSIGLLLIPAFIFWVGRQERLGRPAIIPNSLWSNRIFTTICLSVFLIWGVFNAVENLMAFVFQYVQNISAKGSSIRFLPAPVAGAITNIIIGLIVDKVRADRLVIVTTLVACGAPLLMAIINPRATYWAYEFPALALNPVGADVLFTISNLLITSLFPSKTQALAGGVFNTVAQVGKSIGLATSAIIASSVTARSSYYDKESGDALLAGYKAAFWYVFALGALTVLISAWGLRNIGKVGLKRE